MFLTQNLSIVNPILQKLHALGFTQVQRPVNNRVSRILGKRKRERKRIPLNAPVNY